MLTLQEYADRILTPMLLRQCGLPDNEQGREALDALVDYALAEEGWDD